MYVNLTKKQMNSLVKGKNVRVSASQLGETGSELLLDNMGKRKWRASVKHNKGMTIRPDMMLSLQGSGFNKVMSDVKKSIKKTYKQDIQPELRGAYKSTKKEVKGALKDIFSDIKSTAKESAKRKVKEKQEELVQDLMDNNFINEEKAERLLEKLGMPSDLADDLITKSNIKLRETSLRQLNNLENSLVDTLDRVGAVKGDDYEIETMDNEQIQGMGLKPKKGKKHYRVVYIKGGNVKKFFKKIGRVASNIIKNPAVNKVLKQLATTGVSTLGSMVGVPPSITASLSKPLVDMAIDQGTKELDKATSGSGLLTRGQTEVRGVSKMGMGMGKKCSCHGGAMYIPGGAMYAPGYTPRPVGVGGRGLVGPQQGGKYYI